MIFVKNMIKTINDGLRIPRGGDKADPAVFYTFPMIPEPKES